MLITTNQKSEQLVYSIEVSNVVLIPLGNYAVHLFVCLSVHLRLVALPRRKSPNLSHVTLDHDRGILAAILQTSIANMSEFGQVASFVDFDRVVQLRLDHHKKNDHKHGLDIETEHAFLDEPKLLASIEIHW